MSENLHERHIFFVSETTVQNRLLVRYVAERTGAHCTLEGNLRKVASFSGKNAQKILVLFDCLDRSRAELLEMLQSEARDRLQQHYLAMFNLDSASDLEMEALSHGICGLHYVHDPVEAFLRMIGVVLGGQLWYSRRLLSDVCKEVASRSSLASSDSTGLTRREVEVLKLTCQGKRNKEIADALFVSLHTIKTHQNHIFKKLGVSSRNQAAYWASKNL
ncbi:MAG: response regulator transcription factor [Desulfuromonadaceae bacterium]